MASPELEATGFRMGRSLMASPELEATRTRMGITETYLCVCLDLNKHYSNSDWFTLAPIPKQEKLQHNVWFPMLYPEYSTVISIGSEIYIIGGLLTGYGIGSFRESVLVFDCRTNQKRKLPKMRLSRDTPAVDVIDGKIYVIGGTESNSIEDWGEVYDPKTQTWEPVLPTTLDLTKRMSVVPGKLVMGGKVYAMQDGYNLRLMKDFCLVEIDNMLYQTRVSKGILRWSDPKKNLRSTRVKGLERLPKCTHLTLSANSDGGRKRVIVWWKTVLVSCDQSRSCTKECKTKIWCAEISFKRQEGLGELWGYVEWSKNVLTLRRCDIPNSRFLLNSVIVTY